MTNSSGVQATSTPSLMPQNTAGSSRAASTQQLLSEWLVGKGKAPTQPVQAKRARLLQKLSDLTSFQKVGG